MPAQTAPQPSPDAEKEKQRKKLNKQLELIEQEVATFEKEVKDKENALASPDIYQNAQKLTSAQEGFKLSKQKLAEKQKEWDKIAVEIDKLS